MLVSMPRAPVKDAGQPPLLEAIAGTIGQDPEESAMREAMEDGDMLSFSEHLTLTSKGPDVRPTWRRAYRPSLSVLV